MVRIAKRPPARAWRLDAPVAESGSHRVVARFDEASVAFWSEGAPLAAAPEAFAGPLLLGALKARRRLAVEAPLDAAWVDRTRRLARLVAGWWRYPRRYPLVDVRSSTAAAPPPAAARGLCFTGGVDSFFALLSEPGRYDALVYVHGLDVPLDDGFRRAAIDASLREIAAAHGLELLVLATNLRAIDAVERVGWGRMHGAALAAAGHALGTRLGELTIAPSWHTEGLEPWGSHPETDGLWSSSRVAIRHGDATLCRAERTRRIASHPLVRRHLRVCWENRAPAGNCSRCEKCLRTMATLAALGVLDAFPVFDGEAALARRLAALPPVPPHVVPLWEEILALDPPADLARRIRAVMDRAAPIHQR